MFINIRPIFKVLCKLTLCQVFSINLGLWNRLFINPGSLLAQYFKLLEFWGPIKKYLKGKHYGHVFVSEILCEKIKSLAILKNAKTASNFCFPCSERLIFYGIFGLNWHGQIYPGRQNAKKIKL